MFFVLVLPNGTVVFAAFAGGNAPDIINVLDYLYPKFVQKKLLAEISLPAFGVKSKEELEALYEPGALVGNTVDGKIYGVPEELNTFGWVNSYAGIVIPTALNAAGIFIIRQAMLSIPDDFIEAARVDGASEPRILFSIVVPMLAPSLTVAAVLTFNLSWNSFLWPLIVTRSDALRTLPLGMAAFEKTFYTLYGEIMAVSVFGTIPFILFFMLFQKYFIESAVTANLK